jgi:uncharacterized Tic20 family protein
MGNNDSQGMTIFILGLLSLVMCQLLGPVAWMMGNNYMRECVMEGIEPDGMAVAGRVMGIIGTVLMGLSFLLVGLYVCLIIGIVASA